MISPQPYWLFETQVSKVVGSSNIKLNNKNRMKSFPFNLLV